jgi:hypothetical protein
MNTAARLKFADSERISLSAHPDYDEAWLEALIRSKIAILGLGSLDVISAQKSQSKGGRLDLLLRDSKNQTIFVVELMLGTLDETHIVRTIEYWLRERAQKQNKDYDHIAVLAAENVLGNRFVDVVRFLSGQMPLVLLEIHALRIEDRLTIQFSKVFDGRDTESEETSPATEATRESWIEASSQESVLLAEQFFEEILKPIENDISLTFKQQFLGLRVGNRVNNFVLFNPKRQFVRVRVKTSQAEDFAERLKSVGVEVLGDPPSGRLKFRLTTANFNANKAFYSEICKAAYEE